MKDVLAVIFGGKSVEHDISIITGMQVLKNLSSSYNTLPVYIHPDGKWYIADNLDKAETFLNFEKNVIKKKQVTPVIGKPYLVVESGGKYKKHIKLDCALLCTHGRNGEDGTLQGLLDLCFIPYTSCSTLSSAICMDKAIAKRIMRSYKIPTPKFVDFYASEYKKNKFQILNRVNSDLTFPLIVKPAGLGSSVGISICEDIDSLPSHIENAIVYDGKIIIEEFISDAKEFCVAVTKINGSHLTSNVQEVHKGEIYTFEDKYLNKKQEIIANITPSFENKLKKLACTTYRALECDGIVRIDFLCDKDDKIFVNELNTIPGSLAFNLFDSPFRDLLDIIILEAKDKLEVKEKEVYKFNSKAIENYVKIMKQNKYSK